MRCGGNQRKNQSKGKGGDQEEEKELARVTFKPWRGNFVSSHFEIGDVEGTGGRKRQRSRRTRRVRSKSKQQQGSSSNLTEEIQTLKCICFFADLT